MKLRGAILFAFFGFIFFSLPIVAQQPAENRTNPDISVNALFLGRGSTRGQRADAEAKNGFQIQEVEVRMTSNIDAYFRGELTLAVHPEVEEEEEHGEEEEEEEEHEGHHHSSYHVEPEEAFVETLSLPNLTVRAGKFFASLGRHNLFHTHYFPFIDAPLTNTQILGDEGLNEVGISVAYLTPAPWYLEVVGQGFSAQNENLFGSATQDDVMGLFALKNLWDLSTASTLAFDLAYANGGNEFKGTSHVYVGSLTYKWRPLEKSVYRSFLWTAEYFHAEREKADEGRRKGGFSSWVQYQFARQWWAQLRGEYFDQPADDFDPIKKYSALVGYVPTEYSALRLQYDHIDDQRREDPEQRVSLQLNISMGTHPAHNY